MKRITLHLSLLLLCYTLTTLPLLAQHEHDSEQSTSKKVEKTWPKSVEDHSHSHKGVVFMGGALSFYHDVKTNSTSFEFHPEGGYLFNDRWGLGLLLGIGINSHKEGGEIHTEQEFKVSPFARWYYFRPTPFNLYLDMGAGWNLLRTKQEDGSYKNNHGFEVGVRPGACIDLIEGLCLCIRLGFIGYRQNYFAGEEQLHGVQSGSALNGFLFHFNPEAAMIGLELEF